MYRHNWSILNELAGKAVHLVIILALLFYVVIKQQYSQTSALIFLVALLLIFLVLEYLRLDLNLKMPLYSLFIKPKEETRLSGAIYFLSATIICLAVFDFNIAIAALLMVIIGDAVAAMAGKRYGKTLLYRNKTAIGALAELIINLAIALIILRSTSIYVILATAFTATIVETLADEVDDNLLVPLFASFVGQMISYL